MYAAWCPDGEDAAGFAARLLDDVAPALLDAGAHMVRVHVTDDEVAPGAGFFPAGHRRAALAPPIDAVVSAWVDTAVTSRRAGIDGVFADAGIRVAGYLVSESVPLAAEDAASTHDDPAPVRTPGFTQVAFLRVPEGMDPREWRSRWKDGHTDVAIDTQSTTAYRQNLVVHPLQDDAPTVAAIVEETFPIGALTDPYVFFDAVGDDARFSANVEAMIASTSSFLDTDHGLDTVPASEYVLAAISPRW